MAFPGSWGWPSLPLLGAKGLALPSLHHIPVALAVLLSVTLPATASMNISTLLPSAEAPSPGTDASASSRSGLVVIGGVPARLVLATPGLPTAPASPGMGRSSSEQRASISLLAPSATATSAPTATGYGLGARQEDFSP